MTKYVLIIWSVLLVGRSHAQTEIATEVSTSAGSASSIIVEENSVRFFLPKEGAILENYNDRPLYAGSVRNKKLNGNWQSWYQNGILCDSGAFVRGLPDGEWKHWDVNGRLVAIRTYNADKYQRISLEMLRYSPRKPAYPITQLYFKNRSQAMQYLHASYSFPHKVKRIDDLSLQQWVIENITPGNVYHPVFDQSLHHGLFINYFENGLTKDSGYYNNGLRHGVWIERSAQAGNWQQGNYINGKRNKEWKTYSVNGELMEIAFYNNHGEVSGRKTFRRN